MGPADILYECMVRKAEQLPLLETMLEPVYPEHPLALEVGELCAFVFSTVIKILIWVALNGETRISYGLCLW